MVENGMRVKRQYGRAAALCTMMWLSGRDALPSIQVGRNPQPLYTDERMIHDCEALFLGAGDQRAAHKRLWKVAPKSLMNVSQHYLSRGSLAYASVSYVMAYRGIEVENNVGGMLSLHRQPFLVPPDSSHENVGDDKHLFESLERAVIRIYKTHPADGVLRQVLIMSGAGRRERRPLPTRSPADALSSSLASRLFFAHPVAMVCAAAAVPGDKGRRNGQYRLAELLLRRNPDLRKVEAVIARLEKDHDPAGAKRANLFRATFQKEVAREHARRSP